MSLIGQTAAPAADIIKNTTDAEFMADVVEASKIQPVIVDFWAEWCGPCRQLGPSLEKAVTAAKGAVKLVKVDIDANPAYAGQLRVQSIPAVFAFVDGQPVDGFMGALPDSQVRDFVDRMAKLGPGSASPIDELLEAARESLALGDLGGAAQAYAGVLQSDPENAQAIGGLAGLYLTTGDLERAREVAAIAPPTAKDPELDRVRAALALADAAPSETAAFEVRLTTNPDDHEARFELASALAGQHRLDEAADQLLTIISKEPGWNEDAARKQLLVVMEAAGIGSITARNARRRLSAILFS